MAVETHAEREAGPNVANVVDTPPSVKVGEGLTMVQQLSRRGPPAAAQIAATIDSHRNERDAIMAWLHQSGNGQLVQAVIAAAQAASHSKDTPLGTKAHTGDGIDGDILGSNQKAYPGSTPTDQIPAFEPAGGKPQGQAMYVNGILVDPEREAGTPQSGAKTSEAQLVADGLNMEVFPVHNASKGMFKDSLETITDKISMSSEPAVKTIADSMIQHVKSGQPMTYVGHSQGASQICRAIELTIATMKQAGAAPEEIQQHLSVIHVVTLAGSAAHWPNGPRYDHYVNTKDAVPTLLGVGGWFSNGGAGAHFHHFAVKSTRRDEDGLTPGVANPADMMTNAVNRSQHGLGLYIDAITGKPIQQADGVHAVTVTDSTK